MLKPKGTWNTVKQVIHNRFTLLYPKWKYKLMKDFNPRS
jgi:hypothetical protein